MMDPQETPRREVSAVLCRWGLQARRQREAGRRRGQRIQEFKVQGQLRELTQEEERGPGAGGQPTEGRGLQEQEDQKQEQEQEDQEQEQEQEQEQGPGAIETPS